MHVIFKDAYRMLGSAPYHVVYINWEVSHKYKLEDIVNPTEVCLRQGMRLIAKSKPIYYQVPDHECGCWLLN